MLTIAASGGGTSDGSASRLAAGAEFIVMICGDIMTMPGLPKVPASETIRFNEAGQIEGLF